jgi:curli biogenesis system outer membrane secretion channel CsgG
MAVLAVGLSDLAEARKRSEESASDDVEVSIPSMSGPKRSVAVADFKARNDFTYEFGDFDVGRNLTAMLTTALLKSGQFVIVERQALGDVLAEQELSGTGLVNYESAVETGDLIGAQLLVLGHVTDFTQNESGGSGGLGLALAGKTIGFAPKSSKSTVGIDVRILDSGSGQVIAAFHIEKSVKSRSSGVSFNMAGLSFSGSDFESTPIGEATRQAIEGIAHRLAKEAAGQPWLGNVVDFDDGEVAINAGHNAGIKVGDSFTIHRISKTLTDPVTGRVIGQRKRHLGTVRIIDVQGEIAFGLFDGSGQASPRRGDLVTQT